AKAYQEDHLPGAISAPVVADRLAKAQFTPMESSIPAVAGEAAPTMPPPLAPQVERLSPGDAVLVYCDRGGLDSMAWAGPLRVAGFRVDVLGGGWINYRRWVSAGLELLPRALTFRPLLAPPAGGLCRLVDRLLQQGEQVIDLTALAGQRLVPGLTLEGDLQPTQAAFETGLLDALRKLDPQRPVWIRMGLAGHGGLALPPALRDALYRSISIKLEVPLNVRVLAWSDRLQAMGAEINNLLQAISASANSPDAAAIEQWRSLTNAGRVTDALTEIIATFIDPHTEISEWGGQVRVVRLASLTNEAVAAEVEDWRRHG
ncbi:hypothetical protein, partial [Ideonella sp.]|uniref:hypothetical protein n=1 Tax=Ideonella sp. TaxID=1929293 RepID=UPI003BB713D4